MKFAIPILFVVACAAPQVKSSDVRKVDQPSVAKCEPRGTIDEQIEASGQENLAEQVMAAAKERAASRGANRLVVTNKEADDGFARLQAEVFYCE
jgi:hypothetical protein